MEVRDPHLNGQYSGKGVPKVRNRGKADFWRVFAVVHFVAVLGMWLTVYLSTRGLFDAIENLKDALK